MGDVEVAPAVDRLHAGQVDAELGRGHPQVLDHAGGANATDPVRRRLEVEKPPLRIEDRAAGEIAGRRQERRVLDHRLRRARPGDLRGDRRDAVAELVERQILEHDVDQAPERRRGIWPSRACPRCGVGSAGPAPGPRCPGRSGNCILGGWRRRRRPRADPRSACRRPRSARPRRPAPRRTRPRSSRNTGTRRSSGRRRTGRRLPSWCSCPRRCRSPRSSRPRPSGRRTRPGSRRHRSRRRRRGRQGAAPRSSVRWSRTESRRAARLPPRRSDRRRSRRRRSARTGRSRR